MHAPLQPNLFKRIQPCANAHLSNCTGLMDAYSLLVRVTKGNWVLRGFEGKQVTRH